MLAVCLAVLPTRPAAVVASMAPNIVDGDVDEVLDVLRASARDANTTVAVVPPMAEAPPGTVDLKNDATHAGVAGAGSSGSDT